MGGGPAAAPQPPNAAAANMAAMPNKTNCDISNTTDNAMLQNRSTMPNHQPNLAPNQQPPPPQQRLMAQQPQMHPPQMRGPSPNMRQPMQSGFPQQDPMGRPSLQQNRQPSFDMGGQSGSGGATGGYNFQRIMDDHFEHYKRAPSRERSVDKTNLPASLAEAPMGVVPAFMLEVEAGRGPPCSEMLPIILTPPHQTSQQPT